MIRPPFSPQYFAEGIYSLLKVFFVCVYNQKNNVTFPPPPCFLFLCYGLVNLDQLRCISFLTVCQAVVCRILIKVIVFIDIPQLVCTLQCSYR